MTPLDAALALRPGHLPPDVRRLVVLHHLVLATGGPSAVRSHVQDGVIPGACVGAGVLPGVWGRGPWGEQLATSAAALELAGRAGMAVARRWDGVPTEEPATGVGRDVVRARQEGGRPELPALAEVGPVGQVWLLRALWLPAAPGTWAVKAAVTGVGAVLHRHLKAAERRLRADQVERVEVRLGAVSWPGCAPDEPWTAQATWRSVPRAVAVLVLTHAFTPELLADGLLERERERLDALAAKVVVRPDPTRSVRELCRLVDLCGREALDLATLGASLRDGASPRALGELALTWAAATKGPLDTRAWRYPAGADVRVYTTRGGSWPEHAEVPDGAPGTPADRLEAGIVERFSRGDGQRRRAAEVLLGPSDDLSAEAVRELLER